MVDDDVKERVKEATDIVALVGQFVTLKKRGTSFTGLCPFHTEKTPSFHVHPDRQYYHCFGCGRGGDVFAFLMEHEGWSFPEALRYCADKAGIRLPTKREATDGDSQRRQDVMAALALADETYRRFLFSTAGQTALRYMTERGFHEATLRRAGVGYAPAAFDTVLKAARARGLSQSALEAAGLVAVSAKDGSPYDRFRNRVTFPIVNLSGKTVGFGARALSDEDQPKYLNSPETVLYQKSRILYGLAVTRDAIRREGRAIVVEGYLDWLTMVEYGLDNVVAVSGTALTSAQAALLRRFCDRVTFLFDADPAGQHAALRGIGIVYGAGLGVDISALPTGEDPDSFLRHEGAERLRSILSAATCAVEYRVRMARSGAPGARLDFLLRERLAKEFAEWSAAIPDATRRETLLSEAAGYLELDEAQLRRALRHVAEKDRPVAPGTSAGTAVRRREAPRLVLDPEEEFLRVLVEDAALLERAREALAPDDFEDSLHRRMFQGLLQQPIAAGAKAAPDQLGSQPDEVEEWSRLLAHPVDEQARDRIFADGLREFEFRRWRQADKPRLKQLIAEAERAGDLQTVDRLMMEFNRRFGRAAANAATSDETSAP